MKKWSIFLTFFFFSIFVCTLKYVNMIRISNICFFRFCWKSRKLDWPKCARTLRSTMKEDRLSGLALVHIHKHDVSFSAEDIVDDFAASGNRRKELLFQLFGLTLTSIRGEWRFFIVVPRSISWSLDTYSRFN